MPPNLNQSSTVESESRKRPADEASAPLNTKKARPDIGNAVDREDGTKLSSGKSKNVAIPSKKLYYEDGNVILISKEIAFRVHRMFLASRSEVFKDMFELATHPTDGECFDGCPTIYLDDNVADLTVFLKALYGHIDVKDIEDDFPKISAVLRLSTKYIINTLRSSCIWHLSLAKVPTTLDAYDKYHDADGPHLAEDRFCYYDLVYKVDATCLLPTSFYILSTFQTSRLDEVDLNLSGDVMLRLYQGKAELFNKYITILQQLQLKTGYCPICQNKKATVIKYRSEALTEPGALEMFDPLLFLIYIRNDCDSLCSYCLLKTRKQLKKHRQEIWNALPRIFKFGDSWDALESQ